MHIAKRNKKGYWSSLRPVPFLNVLCPMAYSSLALSLWSLSFHLFSFCTDCTAMFMADVLHHECRPSIRCFPKIIFDRFENVSFKNLPACLNLIYYLIDAMIWNMGYDPDTSHPASFRFPISFRSLGFHLLGFICLLVCFSLSPVDIGFKDLSSSYQIYFLWIKKYLLLWNSPLSSCT